MLLWFAKFRYSDAWWILWVKGSWDLPISEHSVDSARNELLYISTVSVLIASRFLLSYSALSCSKIYYKHLLVFSNLVRIVEVSFLLICSIVDARGPDFFVLYCVKLTQYQKILYNMRIGRRAILRVSLNCSVTSWRFEILLGDSNCACSKEVTVEYSLHFITIISTYIILYVNAFYDFEWISGANIIWRLSDSFVFISILSILPSIFRTSAHPKEQNLCRVMLGQVPSAVSRHLFGFFFLKSHNV